MMKKRRRKRNHAKKQEKEGKEWMESYLPGAFDEAEELIGAARKRKGFDKKKFE